MSLCAQRDNAKWSAGKTLNDDNELMLFLNESSFDVFGIAVKLIHTQTHHGCFGVIRSILTMTRRHGLDEVFWCEGCSLGTNRLSARLG